MFWKRRTFPDDNLRLTHGVSTGKATSLLSRMVATALVRPGFLRKPEKLGLTVFKALRKMPPK